MVKSRVWNPAPKLSVVLSTVPSGPAETLVSVRIRERTPIFWMPVGTSWASAAAVVNNRARKYPRFFLMIRICDKTAYQSRSGCGSIETWAYSGESVIG